MKYLPAIIVALWVPSVVLAAIQGQELNYGSESNVVLKGYIAFDDSISTPRPGILVVHEWWGHNEYARRRARMLAELGYTALAVDMYGNGKQATHPETAGKFAGEVRKNAKLAEERFHAAIKVLQEHGTTDASQTAAIGYCFGGGVVLHMARQGVDLAAVASFHGSLSTDTPAEKGKVKAKILVCHGAEDPFVSPEVIQAFKDEMKAAGATMTFKVYPGAKHSFTNPDADDFGAKFELPLKYSATADAASWADMQAMFKECFGARP